MQELELLVYKVSEAGISHIKRDIPCQDYALSKVLVNGWVVGAVADGVGSAKHSEIAARLACESVIEVLDSQITENTELNDICDYLREAYSEAEKRIEKYAFEQKDVITDYDTTLHVAVYDGKRVVFGHAGDGGLIGLTKGGLYVALTRPQKADDGFCVIPLRAGEESWEFGFCDEEYTSVLIATDGVYDSFRPSLLMGQKQELYIPLLRWFMDNNILQVDSSNINDVEETRKAFLLSEATSSITDDKTVLVLINPSEKPGIREEEYYDEPDWDALREEWRKKAYPHLYEKEEVYEKEEEKGEIQDDSTLN